MGIDEAEFMRTQPAVSVNFYPSICVQLKAVVQCSLVCGPYLLLLYTCGAYLKQLDEDWQVYRRYSRFRELHLNIKDKFPEVS